MGLQMLRLKENVPKWKQQNSVVVVCVWEEIVMFPIDVFSWIIMKDQWTGAKTDA